ncbi:uncharacterized protein LOC121986587 [Zingiber officinale]|uniref:uncharacterized protein LOC121986587 n=1 Tax=Zingiber officinale TaxID=94328 RepID=UPI001C4DC703|nr:uncharacterized protein LOC121986587 [Zingiber officinale]
MGSDIDDKGSCSVKLPQQNDNKLNTDKTFPSYEEFNDVKITDIVAYGTVIEVNGVNHSLHDVPLPKNCMRVSIDEAMQKSTCLLVLIPNECETIGDAVGTHVAWPKHLLMLRQKKRQMKKMAHVENNQTLSSSVPRSLRMVYCYCKCSLENGRKLSIFLDHEVFQDDYELNLHLEDISSLYHLEPISGNCVVVYICFADLLLPFSLRDVADHRSKDDGPSLTSILESLRVPPECRFSEQRRRLL